MHRVSRPVIRGRHVNMARIETELFYFFVFIVFYAQNAIRVVECEDKRIIIHVPRRVQTVHHHHHHVVFMDPERETMMVARPFPSKPPVSAEGYVQQEMRARGHEYEQHEHQLHKRHRHRQQKQRSQHQEQADGSHPLSYVEQRKTMAAAATRHVRDHKHSEPPYAFIPVHGGSAWRPIAPPVVRDKRSRPWVFARRITTTYGH